jgi:transcriptional regulator with XRE-family HTH domain
MARKRTTGDGDPYNYDEEADLADYLTDDDYWDAVEGEEGETGTIDVEAQIEWAGTVDENGRDGVRRTRLDGIRLDGIRKAVDQLREARRTGPDQPYKSYNAKSWHAQLRHMERTRRGRDLVDRTGISPATIRRWQTGKQAPSRASREKLADAYESMRNPRPGAVRQATHNLAEAFTRALKDQYGVNVRVRDIHHLWIRE